MTAPAETFYVKGGTLRHDARCYVERAADRQLFDLLQKGEFCHVLTSRQMGKSSLMVRTAWRLRQAGISMAVIDLTSIGQNLPPEQWYDGLLARLGWNLDCEDELEEFRQRRSQVGPLQRWLEAIQEIILKPRLEKLRRTEERVDQGGGPIGGSSPARHPRPWSGVVIFIDELDVVRSLPFPTDEFFAAIRECYNRRSVEPEFGLLTFCLLGVASPSDLIRDPRRTPFNIGHRIELSSFTDEEARPLASGLGREEHTAQDLLHRILYWTNGHPYLTQALCQAAASDESINGPAGVDRLCESLFLSSSARDRDDNLLFVREWLLRSQVDRSALLGLYGSVLAGERVPFDRTSELVEVLRLSGVVRVVDGFLAIRNRIYYRVFDHNWLLAHRPGAREAAEQQVYQQGYRRGILASGGVFAIVGLLVIGIFSLTRLGAKYGRLNEARAKEVWLQPLWLARVIPKRPAAATDQQVDLSRYYNGLLGGPWRRVGEEVHLGILQAGLARMPNSPFEIPFDIRGVVQLAAEPEEVRELPQTLAGVRIERRFNHLHLLHSCWRRGTDGLNVASLTLSYKNGTKVEFPITYGEHVSYGWGLPEQNPATNRLVEVWTGWNSAVQPMFAHPRLFKASWSNPYPEQVVVALDITSKLAGTALLIAGLNVE